MSIATVAAQQAALNAATKAAAAAGGGNAQNTAGTAAASAAAAPSGEAALSALSSNFQDFLGMLMTQLKNQDPSSPLDSNQFTQELVAFSGVQQQVNTNTSLTQLIQLTQAGELMQGAALTGKQVQVGAAQLSLQGGHASLRFNAPAAEPVAIAVADPKTGTVLRTATLSAQAGSNGWAWDGQSDAGTQLPDGVYNVAVYGTDAAGNTASLPFTVGGTVTGVVNSGNGSLQLQLGKLSVGFGSVQSMGN